MNINALTDRELFALYGRVLEALRTRGTIRSANNPVADYAEGLCVRALCLTLVAKSTSGYDGTDRKRRRIEIKARRITPQNGSRQLSAIREMEERHFDFLAGILFNADFSVWKGCLIPHKTVKAHSTFNKHTNSHRFLLRDAVWSLPGVLDITDSLKKAQQ